MSDDVRAALDFDALAAKMYADPDLGGDLLAVGLAIAWLIRNGERKIKLSAISERVGWRDWRRVRLVMSDDRPRYLMDTRIPSGGCEAPMIRREGLCGKRSGWTSAWLRDAETGTLRAIAHCSRHREWAYDRSRESKGAWIAAGSPEPPANHGGVLARYFAFDWPVIYRWGDPRWEMPPSGPPDPTVPKPTLTLIVSDGEPDDAAGARPTLALIT